MLPVGEARAQTDFFAGKQISLLIGTTAGGGYDAYGRLVARHIGRHIPGHPAVVAKNMPGAGGLALANHLYNRAPKDGTEILTVQNGLPFEKLFHMLSPDGKAALFDATKFGWIGSMTQTVFVTVTWHGSGIRTLQDASAKETILGASATSADSYVLAMLSNNLLGTKFKVVHGYAGATEVRLAVENGEVEGEAGKDWTTLTSTKPQWIRDKQINIIVQMGMRAHPDIKGVPMAIELARSPDDRRDHGGRVRQVRHVAPVLHGAGPAAGAARAAAARLRRDAEAIPVVLAEAQQARHGDQPGARRGRRSAGGAHDGDAGRARGSAHATC